MITDQQVILLRLNMAKHNNQRIASAKAGMSERTGRKYLKSDALPSEKKTERHWQTRSSPFEDVWSEIEDIEEEQENNEPCDIESFKRDREINQ